VSHFTLTRRGIKVDFSPAEKLFLADVPTLLAEVGIAPDDPAATRLHVPVYLDDPEANAEWWRLMGEDLEESRKSDRRTFEKVLTSSKPPVLAEEQANALLRVINESRLVLAARMGLEVEEDHDELPEHSRQVLDYLGWLLEELTTELSKSL
jgi:hypothetical protein